MPANGRNAQDLRHHQMENLSGTRAADAAATVHKGPPRSSGRPKPWKALWADFPAALSVAAVAVPTAMAYAELADFPPVIGLYSTILPLIAYACLGSSPQLIVG